MEPEERKMLEDTLRIVQHNNRMLRRIRHEVWFARLSHLMYWIIILGISIAGYYYLKPYLADLTQAVQSGKVQLPSNLPR
jgi:hypothetical protein